MGKSRKSSISIEFEPEKVGKMRNSTIDIKAEERILDSATNTT